MDLPAYLFALALILGVAVAAWVVSVMIRNVAFVDSLWSLFFLIAAVVFAVEAAPLSARGLLVTLLVAVWALRLSLYIAARNWGEPEDYRYRKIRENNEPGFAFKSLYVVFGLQGILAWIIAMPLLPAIMNRGGIGPLEIVAAALWLVGFIFEAGGDYQLAKFGDFCIWWAFYLFAFAAGGWWTIVSPLLMSFLLLKVSGVAMLEKTITDRRPDYAEYIRRTNAFFPGLPKGAATALRETAQ